MNIIDYYGNEFVYQDRLRSYLRMFIFDSFPVYFPNVESVFLDAMLNFGLVIDIYTIQFEVMDCLSAIGVIAFQDKRMY